LQQTHWHVNGTSHEGIIKEISEVVSRETGTSVNYQGAQRRVIAAM